MIPAPARDIPVNPLALLIVQATQFCNINCRYCYLPHRNQHKLMTEATLDAVVQRLQAHPLTHEDVVVVWHAGEPLTAGIPFYEAAFARFATLTNARFNHTIQTNATLINEDWCRFFKKHNISIGISLDGPKHIHDANRVTRAGRGTHDTIMKKIAMLREHGIKFTILSVITSATLPNMEDLFRFYDDSNLRNVGLLIEEQEGVNTHSTLENADTASIAKLWAQTLELSTRHNITVREVQDMVPRLLGEDFHNSQTTPGDIISIGRTGDFSTYSPELLEQSSKTYGNFVIGNVHKDSFMEAFQSAKNEVFYRDLQAGVAKCASECDYFDVCKGGTPSNKASENGTFDSSKTEYCERFFRARAEAFLTALERAP